MLYVKSVATALRVDQLKDAHVVWSWLAASYIISVEYYTGILSVSAKMFASCQTRAEMLTEI